MSCKGWLLLATLLLLGSAISLPQCQVGSFYLTLPLTPSETHIINLDQLFTGYNLNYTSNIPADVQPHTKLSRKERPNEAINPDVPMSGLKTYHLDHIGNSWGPRFITLTQQGDRSRIHIGVLNNNETAPIINNVIDVENYTNTTCYDSILFPKENLIIVDCAEKRTTPTRRGALLDNYFYYFAINNGSFVKKVKTEMFVPYTQVNERRLEIYTSVLNQHPFLLRTYAAKGMGDGLKDNTYVEVFMIEDPLDAWVLGVIDKTFLGVKKLRIMEVQVLLGNIYILDEVNGVFRVRITGSEDLEFEGKYEGRGFSRMGLFAPNQDEELTIVLANDHAVHQVDWTDPQQPRLVNKYSLMPDSTVSQVFINSRFLFVQSASKDSGKDYFYTWILRRGDRTYTRAFYVLRHSTNATLIDLNPQSSFLMVIQQTTISNLAFDEVIFSIQLPYEETMIDQMRNLTITAHSTDPMGGTPLDCTLVLNFTLLDEYNRTMWPKGEAPPNTFNANYPGKLMIELHEYVIGPNVTYRIQQTEKGIINKSKIFQEEQLTLEWVDDHSPPLDGVNWLQSETIHGESVDELLIYMQNEDNTLYISECMPDHQLTTATCRFNSSLDLDGPVIHWTTTLFSSIAQQESHHLIVYSISPRINELFLADLTGQRIQREIPPLPKGFPGNISSIATSGRFLFVVLKYIKSISVYPLQLCLQDDLCEPQCKITHTKMFKIGVKYFAPQAIRASKFHPDLLFIKTSDSIIVVNIAGGSCSPKLVTTIRPVPNANTDYVFEINANHLVIIIPPTIVHQYDLTRLRLGEATLTKAYPLYGYKLPKNYNFDLSDYSSCAYLSAMNDGGEYSVFVYRSGFPAVGSLYNQINLYAFEGVLIDASGQEVDYLTVLSKKELRVYRQYEMPELHITNPNKDYQFYLNYYNVINKGQLELVDVKIINLPTYITVNPYLRDIMNTKDLLYSGSDRTSEINDTDWYQGNVLFIKPKCEDCGSKVIIKNHIEGEGDLHVGGGLMDYEYSSQGGVAQGRQQLFYLKSNGTVKHTVPLPHSQKQLCQVVSMGGKEQYTVSACQSDTAISLTLTSNIGDKPFPLPPFLTQAQNLLSLKAQNQLIMLVDSQPDPYSKSTTGGIFIYEINSNEEVDEALVQLEYFEGEDFGMRELGKIFINNAELVYDPVSNHYRLYITEMTRGLFVIEFEHRPGRSDLVVKGINFVNVKSLLSSMKETLPYDATFQAVTAMPSASSSTAQLLITTGRFNTIHLELVLTPTTIASAKIKRFYLRYSFYEVANQIKHVNDLFVIKHVLSDNYLEDNMTQQLYTVYSSRDAYWNGTQVEKRGMIGAYPLPDDKTHAFDFNLTVDPLDPYTEPRTNIAIVENGHDQIERASLHRNLSLYTTQLLDTQIIYIDLINDFNVEKIRILLNGRAPFPEWKLILIILSGIIGLVLLSIAVFLIVRKVKAGQLEMEEDEDGQPRETLITEETYQ